jgi:flagellar biosynthesis/type III secretory pathway chaperone
LIKDAAGVEIWGKIETMPYILEHLTSLRQEITDLRNMNVQHNGKGIDHQIDQSAVEMRANRLAEIKKELSQMLNRPEDPKVWWEKGGRGNRVA